MDNNTLRKQIKSMKDNGKTVREITRALQINNRTYYEIVRAEAEPIPKDEELTEETPKGKNEKKLKRPAMETDEVVQDLLFSEFEKVGNKELLPLLKEEFVQRFKNGAILLHYDIRYRREVEDMGVEWGEFIDYCFDIGYKLLIDAKIKESMKEEETTDMQDMIKAGVTMKTLDQMGK
jgi:hypothetical protein